MKTRRYFALVFKRACKLYPRIMMLAIVLVIALVSMAALLINQNNKSESKQKMRVGIVGDSTDSYLGIGVDILTEIDVSRYSIDFIRTDEQSAINEVKAGKMTGYVKLPDGFIQSVVYGENEPVLYVTNSSPTGFGSVMVEEIGSIISDMIISAQNAILGMQGVAKETGNDNDLLQKTEDLNVEYIDNILNRSKSFEVQYIGVADTLSLGAYLICGILMLLLLLWGIVCNGLLSKKDRAFDMLLYSKGQSVVSQVMCETVSYFCVIFVTFLIFAVVTGGIFQNVTTGITELDKAHFSDYLGFVFSIIPVLLMVSCLHVFIYDLISGDVGNILFQFVFALSTGYISGCLYPSYFFPLALQKTAEILPTGAGVLYLRQSMAQNLSEKTLAMVLGYAAVFFVLTLLTRKYRLAGKRE